MTRRSRHNRFRTQDSYQNFAANVGYGTNNLSAGSQYGFNPVTRNRVQLDFMYRGSWIVKAVVDSVADDMTRAGIDIQSDMPPAEVDDFNKHLEQLQVWNRINSTIKWSRLYGGAIAVMMLDGHRLDRPFTLDQVGPGSFKGLLVLDRWMLQPYGDEVVTTLGADFGDPKYYTVVSDSRSLPNMKIHHTRVVRLDGIELPYWQKMAENGWGMSVIEPMYDRLVALDSATVGVGQLVYRAHLRTYKVENLREVIAAGGKIRQALEEQIKYMRLMQSNEGITLMDANDSFEAHSFAFGGLSDVLIQLGQQISGATGIPLTRLFGQSPAGLNSTGESDMRNYYDMIKATQEARLRAPLTLILHVAYKSRFNKRLPEGFSYVFNSLWQLSDMEKAQIASTVTGALDQAVAGGVLNRTQAMKEMREISKTTGIYTNITDEDIQASEQLESSPLSEELGPPPAMGVAAAHAPSPSAGPHPPTSMGEHVMMHHGPSSPLLSGDTETVQNRPGLRVAK